MRQPELRPARCLGLEPQCYGCASLCFTAAHAGLLGLCHAAEDLPSPRRSDPDRKQCLKQHLCWRRIVRPAPAPLTTAAVQADGAYLMDCGRVFVMWLGRNISPEFMTQASSGPLLHREAGRPSEAALGPLLLTGCLCFMSHGQAPMLLLSSRMAGSQAAPCSLVVVDSCHAELETPLPALSPYCARIWDVGVQRATDLRPTGAGVRGGPAAGAGRRRAVCGAAARVGALPAHQRPAEQPARRPQHVRQLLCCQTR